MHSPSYILIVFVEVMAVVSISGGCKTNQIGWKNEKTGDITCEPCTSCPKGMEPSIECGTTVNIGTVLECKSCIEGKTYSNSEGIELCQACTVCSQGVAVIKDCTTESNTRCGSCSPGHYKDDFIGDCFKCSWCCDGNSDYASDCTSQGLPLNQSCKNLGNNCGQTSAVSHLKTTPGSTTTRSRILSNASTDVLITNVTDEKQTISKKTENKKIITSAPKSELVVIIAVPLMVMVTAGFIYFSRRRIYHCFLVLCRRENTSPIVAQETNQDSNNSFIEINRRRSDQEVETFV